MLTALSFILTGLLLGKYIFAPDELDDASNSDTTITSTTSTNANNNDDNNSLITPMPNTPDDTSNVSTVSSNNDDIDTDAISVNNVVSNVRITTDNMSIGSTHNEIASSNAGNDDTAGIANNNDANNDETTDANSTRSNSILSSIIH